RAAAGAQVDANGVARNDVARLRVGAADQGAGARGDGVDRDAVAATDVGVSGGVQAEDVALDRVVMADRAVEPNPPLRVAGDDVAGPGPRRRGQAADGVARGAAAEQDADQVARRRRARGGEADEVAGDQVAAAGVD